MFKICVMYPFLNHKFRVNLGYIVKSKPKFNKKKKHGGFLNKSLGNVFSYASIYIIPGAMV